MDQRIQGSFLFGTMSPEVHHTIPTSSLLQIHQRAMQMTSSPSTLSQHVHAYSHVGKTKSGSNSSSSVGSQNGSANSASHTTSNSTGAQGHVPTNAANFSNQLSFSPSTNYSGGLTPIMTNTMAASPMKQQHVATMPMHPVVSQFGTMLPLLSNQHAPLDAPVEAQSRSTQGGSQAAATNSRTSNSASSSSFSYPSGGNSGGSNSSDTRTQLSSGDSEDEGGAGAGGEGPLCRRTARREYHKKIERKRRDRMRMLYDKLRSLTEASELADKNGVLEGAIALIQELKQQNQDLMARAAVMEGQESGQCSSSSTGDSREGSVASSGETDQREPKRPKTAR